MNKQEFYDRLKLLEEEFNEKKNLLIEECALSNNVVKIKTLI